MMDVNYLGHACFLLRGKKIALVTDPYSAKIGLKLPRITAEIVTISHDHYDHNNASAVRSQQREGPFVVNGPGEYEIAEVSVFGVATYHDDSEGSKRGPNTVYVITIDGVRLAHLGDLGHLLNEEQLGEVNGVDVLFVPVGGTYTLGAKEAVEVVGQIEPKIVIPMHYQLPGLKIKLASVEDFLKEMGAEEVEATKKLVIAKERLPEEKKVVVLKQK